MVMAAGHTELTGYGHAAFKIVTPQGHFDRIGDSVAIAKSTGAQLVANDDLSNALVAALSFPEKRATAATKGNSGGTISGLDGEVNVTFVPAVHALSITVPGSSGGHYMMDSKRATLAVQYVHPHTVIPMHHGTYPILSDAPEEFAKALKARRLSTKLDVMKPDQTLTFLGPVFFLWSSVVVESLMCRECFWTKVDSDIGGAISRRFCQILLKIFFRSNSTA